MGNCVGVGLNCIGVGIERRAGGGAADAGDVDGTSDVIPLVGVWTDELKGNEGRVVSSNVDADNGDGASGGRMGNTDTGGNLGGVVVTGDISVPMVGGDGVVLGCNETSIFGVVGGSNDNPDVFMGRTAAAMTGSIVLVSGLEAGRDCGGSISLSVVSCVDCGPAIFFINGRGAYLAVTPLRETCVFAMRIVHSGAFFGE